MSRARRWIGHVVAVVALAMLGRPFFAPVLETPPPTTEVTLWTAGAAVAAPGGGTHVALPDAMTAPDAATRIPDAAFLRRAFPALQRVVIEGDGLDPGATAALTDLDVKWRRPFAPQNGRPVIVSLSASRVLSVGQRMTVQGRVRGMRTGEAIIASLEGPDGSTGSAEVSAAGEGEGTFAVTSRAAAVAPGVFEWRLRLGPAGESWVVGAVVTQPEPPRVLILQGAPTVEGARLQRWLADVGSPVTARVRVSAEHVRFAAANESPAEFARIEAATLASFDLVIASAGALRELSLSERAVMARAIGAEGLGLLVVGEPEANEAETFFSPWSVRAVGGDDDKNVGRLARLRLSNGTELVEPVTVWPAEFAARPDARWLVRDARERVLGAAVRRGRGWVARTLVIDTWRWLQGGHPDVFAAYWSSVLSALARPRVMSDGRWSVEDGTGPIFVDDLVRLSWSGGPAPELPKAEIRRVGEVSAVPVSLMLARATNEPGRAEAHYRPAQPGWHEVRVAPAGAGLTFYVQPAGALPGVRAELRRGATARWVESAAGATWGARVSDFARPPRPAVHYGWLALFLLSAGWLWLDQRRP